MILSFVHLKCVNCLNVITSGLLIFLDSQFHPFEMCYLFECDHELIVNF